MNVNLSNGWRLKPSKNKLSWALQRPHRTKKGKDEWKTMGFYGTPSAALRGTVEHLLRWDDGDDVDLDGFVARVRDYEHIISNAMALDVFDNRSVYAVLHSIEARLEKLEARREKQS